MIQQSSYQVVPGHNLNGVVGLGPLSLRHLPRDLLDVLLLGHRPKHLGHGQLHHQANTGVCKEKKNNYLIFNSNKIATAARQ